MYSEYDYSYVYHCILQFHRSFCYYYNWGPFIFSLKNSFHPFPSGRYNGDEFPQLLFVWGSLSLSISFFIWLCGVPVAVYETFSWGMPNLSCNMWDLFPCPGIEPRPPALVAPSLSHWTTRKVSSSPFLKDNFTR